MREFCEFGGLARLADAINKTLAPIVKATFEGEDLIIETESNRLWLDSDFRIVGEAVTPSSAVRSGRRTLYRNRRHRPLCRPCTQVEAGLLQRLWRRLR